MKTTIGTISLERMTNGAHFLFMSDVLSRAEANEKVHAKAGIQIRNLKEALEQEDADLKLTRKSLYTDEINDADKERDKVYMAYKKAVQSYLNLPIAEMAQAAKVLNQHIIDYAINPAMQLDRETGMMMNLIADLEGKFKEQVSTLSLTNFVEKLKEANDKVHTATTHRTDERMMHTTGALKTSRKASDDAYHALVTAVNGLVTMEDDEEYGEFVEYLNTEIAHYKREALGQRASSSMAGGGIPADVPPAADSPASEGTAE